MHVGINPEDEMENEAMGGDIFPKRFHMEFSDEEHTVINAARAGAEANHIFFDTATAMMVLNTIRELKQSNKLRGGEGTNII